MSQAGGRRDAVAETVVRQLAQRPDRLGRLRPGRRHNQGVAEPRSEGDEIGEAAGPHGVAISRLRDAHVGVERLHERDEPSGRTGVKADRVADGQLGAGIRLAGRRSRGCVGSAGRFRGNVVGVADLSGLHRQRAARLGGHSVEVRPTAGSDGSRHRALHERRTTQPNRARRVVQQLDRELGAHQRAAQVHQHEHAVGGHRPFDRRSHPLGVGAQDIGLLESAGRLERQLVAAHLPGEAHDARGERLGVRHDDDPDHAPSRSR